LAVILCSAKQDTLIPDKNRSSSGKEFSAAGQAFCRIRENGWDGVVLDD
jgi:hypothetical protein